MSTKIFLLIALIFSLCAPKALAQEYPSTSSAVKEGTSGALVGTACSEDPQCVVVGETHMLVWKSPAPAKCIVVCIHGLGLCAKAYKPLAEHLSAAGIDGYGVNVRGFGPDREKPERAALDCVKTVDDVCTLLSGLKQIHPDHRIILIGESMGGALSLRIAAEHPEVIDGVIASAPVWKILKRKRTAVKGIFELVFFSNKRPGPAGRSIINQTTKDQQLVQHLLTDRSHRLKLTLSEATAFLRFIDKTDTFAKQLTKPTLIVQGLNDHLVSPKSVARLFKDIPAADKTFLIDAEGEHLVLEEGRTSPAITEKLIEWVKRSNSSPAATIEVVNDDTLSSKEQKLLTKLRRVARPGYAVQYAGALQNVHRDLDFSGKIALTKLASLPHLYAVGPLEGLKGEVTIWNSKPLISRMKGEALLVDNRLDGKACFLVYGQAKSWKSVKLKEPVQMSDIERLVKEQATKYGITPDRPFLFRIEGKASDVQYRVMNNTDSALPVPIPGSHEKAKIHRTLKDVSIQVIGFFSEHHQGIFTHENDSVHMHLKTADDKIAGHLEGIQFDSGARLFLPKR